MKSMRGIVGCVAVSAVLSLALPATAGASGHGGSRGGSAGSGHSQGGHPVVVHGSPVKGRVEVHRQPTVAMHHGGQSGQLSYNAYWRAATSPFPPNPNQNYNRYWQEMQAWQQYHR